MRPDDRSVAIGVDFIAFFEGAEKIVAVLYDEYVGFDRGYKVFQFGYPVRLWTGSSFGSIVVLYLLGLVFAGDRFDAPKTAACGGRTVWGWFHP
ncbi:MAG: hypothetical protein ACK49N_08630 [Verrucomicrobiota bacterium]